MNFKRLILNRILSNKPHEFTIEYVQKSFFKNTTKEVHGQKSHIAKKTDPIVISNS